MTRTAGHKRKKSGHDIKLFCVISHLMGNPDKKEALLLTWIPRQAGDDRNEREILGMTGERTVGENTEVSK